MPRTLPDAETDTAEAERLMLSERDSLRFLDLLENPPAAPSRLVRAANAGFTLPQLKQRSARPF
jgi:uncharacterized protein (DUF1778 family)